MIRRSEKSRSCAGCMILIVAIILTGCTSMGELVKIEPVPGVTQAFILISPEKPVAGVILFAGSHGRLKLKSGSTMGWGQGNFLVRSRSKFAAKGFLVAVIDAPYDRFGYMSMNRTSERHRNHIRAVAQHLKGIADVPVWLVGTSRGTESVANIAINDPAPYAGAVFTSTVIDAAFMEVDRIRLPTLVVHHRWDGCAVSSPSTAETLYDKLADARDRRIQWFDGGSTRGDACEAMSYHGYLGIEQQVVDAIAGFIISRTGAGPGG